MNNPVYTGKIDVFNAYYAEKARYEAEQAANRVEICQILPNNNPLFNNSVLFASINDIDKMNDADIRYFIQFNFVKLISLIFSNENPEYTSVFFNKRFALAMIDVMQNIRYFDIQTIININNLTYQYSVKQDHQDDIMQLLLRMSNIVNAARAVYFKRFSLGYIFESLLLACRYSSFDPAVYVQRVDLLMLGYPKYMPIREDGYGIPTVESVRCIAQIFYELYHMDRWESFLLNYMLHDVDDRFHSTDSTYHLAVLDLLEHMAGDYATLKTTLRNYTEGYLMYHRGKPLKFRLNSVSPEDYPRITAVIQDLRDTEGLIVP